MTALRTETCYLLRHNSCLLCRSNFNKVELWLQRVPRSHCVWKSQHWCLTRCLQGRRVKLRWLQGHYRVRMLLVHLNITLMMKIWWLRGLDIKPWGLQAQDFLQDFRSHQEDYEVLTSRWDSYRDQSSHCNYKGFTQLGGHNIMLLGLEVHNILSGGSWRHDGSLELQEHHVMSRGLWRQEVQNILPGFNGCLMSYTNIRSNMWMSRPAQTITGSGDPASTTIRVITGPWRTSRMLMPGGLQVPDILREGYNYTYANPGKTIARRGKMWLVLDVLHF